MARLPFLAVLLVALLPAPVASPGAEAPRAGAPAEAPRAGAPAEAPRAGVAEAPQAGVPAEAPRAGATAEAPGAPAAAGAPRAGMAAGAQQAGAAGEPQAGAAAGAQPPEGAAEARPAEAAPARVVSINLCTDQLAMLLAGPGQLVSVSHVARDPVSSPLHERAAALPVNHGRAEEIFLLAPDLVLAGEYGSQATLAMLESLGLRVERFPIEADFDDIRRNIRRMGRLLGAEAEAERLVAGMDAGLAAPAPAGPRPRAVLQHANSYTSGAGTLAGAVLEAAGLANAAAEAGIIGMGRLPLERLVLLAPDLVVTGRGYDAPALAAEVLAHPAARGLAGTRRVTVPDALWTCGTPMIAGAVALLREAARGLAPGAPGP